MHASVTDAESDEAVPALDLDRRVLALRVKKPRDIVTGKF